MTIVIVKISIPEVKTAVLTNLPIFGENSSHKASVCMRVGGLKRYLAEFRFPQILYVFVIAENFGVNPISYKLANLRKYDNRVFREKWGNGGG